MLFVVGVPNVCGGGGGSCKPHFRAYSQSSAPHTPSPAAQLDGFEKQHGLLCTEKAEREAELQQVKAELSLLQERMHAVLEDSNQAIEEEKERHARCPWDLG